MKQTLVKESLCSDELDSNEPTKLQSPLWRADQFQGWAEALTDPPGLHTPHPSAPHRAQSEDVLEEAAIPPHMFQTQHTAYASTNIQHLRS